MQPLTKDLLEDWYRQLRKPLRQYLNRRGLVRASEIDDVANEVFVRLMRYSEGELVSNPQQYVFRIARNVSFEWRERSRQKLPHSPDWLEELVAEDEIAEDLARDDVVTRVRESLAKLRPRQREFVMLHVHGMTYKQIAQARNTTYRTVLREITRGYSALRRSMKLEELV